MNASAAAAVHALGRRATPAPPVPSLDALLAARAAARPKQPALVAVDVLSGETRALSYRELYAAARRAAGRLFHAHGLRAGEHVALACGNQPESLVLELAAGLIGAAAVPLDPRRDVVERLIYKLALSEARLLVARAALPELAVWPERLAALRARLPELPVAVLAADAPPGDPLAGAAAADPPPASGATAVLLTLFTSGTTADPKGAQLSAANLLYNADAVRRWLGIGPDDRFGAILPLHHINSTTFALATLLAGGTLVLFSEPPRERFWELLAAQHVTLSSIVPKQLAELLALETPFERARGRLALSRIQIGSDVVDPQAVEAFVARTAIPLYQGYGLTEVAFRATGVPRDLAWADYLALVRRNTIGAALDHVELSIRAEGAALGEGALGEGALGEGALGEDALGEDALGEGVIGELCIRGPIVMQGYLKDPGATAAAFAGGWFHTGELGWYEVLHDRPLYFYHSRLKEIIKKGGALLSPAAIDRAVRAAFPELAEAVAFGYPDPAWGETVWLAVVFAAGVPAERRVALLAEIVARGQAERIPGLPRFEAPARVLDWEAELDGEPLPLTATLKVQRARVRAAVLAESSPP